MRREAFRFIDEGYTVLPLHGKIPAVPKRGKRDAYICRDKFDVYEVWPSDECNVGIVTGEGLAVLDVYVTDGKDGYGSLARLEAEIGPFPVTRRVRTQSGGAHLYFKAPPEFDVTNSDKMLKRFGSGLNVRGKGGHVAAPGSRFQGRVYTLEVDIPLSDIPEIPAALLSLLKAAPQKVAVDAIPLSEIDAPEEFELPYYLGRSVSVSMRGEMGVQLAG